MVGRIKAYRNFFITDRVMRDGKVYILPIYYMVFFLLVLTLNWDAFCLQVTGSQATGYIVEYRIDAPFKRWKELKRVETTMTDITELPVGKYKFRIKGYNSIGVSDPSNTISTEVTQ